MDKLQKINQLVSYLYKDKTGIRSSYDDIDIPANENYFSSGYGEIVFESIPILLKEVTFEEDDIFLDLGSGIGRFCIEIFLTTQIKKVVGIELERNRHLTAMQAKNKLQKYLSPKNKLNRELQFYQENIANFDFTKYNIIYMCSLCFPDKLLKIISNKLNEHPSLKAVLSFNKLDLEKIPLKKIITIPTSWTNNESIYYYSF